MDTLRYKVQSKHEHFIILFDDIDDTFAIHSKDYDNDTAVIIGFKTAAKAIEFAHERIISIERSSIH